MADQQAKDAAAQQRIITHMNNDHHDSVIRYLEHYARLSPWTAYTGRITAITLSTLTITTSAGTHPIPLSPPLASYRDARDRLVAMDKACAAALGRSDMTIATWPRPRGPHLALLLVVLATMAAFSRRGNFAVGGPLAALVPGALRKFCFAVQPVLFWGMLAIHGTEAVVMARGRLWRHNVNVRSGLFWLWVADAFVEGVGAFQRFDALLGQKQKQKELQKH